MRRWAGLALAGLLALGACRDDGPPVDLDGSPRFPDDEGVATDLSFSAITLDGERTYEVSEELLAFSTYDGQLEPLLNREGQYVQVGLDGDTMVWMAGIARVIRIGDEDAVYYTGHLVEVDDEGRAVFGDGTVLRLADGVESPVAEGFVQARIDPDRRRVVELTVPG